MVLHRLLLRICCSAWTELRRILLCCAVRSILLLCAAPAERSCIDQTELHRHKTELHRSDGSVRLAQNGANSIPAKTVRFWSVSLADLPFSDQNRSVLVRNARRCLEWHFVRFWFDFGSILVEKSYCSILVRFSLDFCRIQFYVVGVCKLRKTTASMFLERIKGIPVSPIRLTPANSILLTASSNF